MHYLSLLTTVITFAFCIAVMARYTHRGGLHLLFWGFGLVLYGLGTLTEVWLGFTFNEYALKIWYLCGAMLTAAWLGQGTVNLLVRKPGLARMLNIALVAVSLLSLVLVLFAPIDAAKAAGFDPSVPASRQYQEIMGRSIPMVLLTILLNIYGTLTLVGGAIYSAYLFWRKRVLANRLLGNILIAAGGLLPAMGGTFVKMGVLDLLYISEFVGVILMFIGFLQATASKK